MPILPAFRNYSFKNNVRWKSGRQGIISAGQKPRLEISSPPEFKGKPGYWSPEDLFLATVNVCLMQTFMEYALRTNLGVIAYTSDAEGVLERAEGRYRFTEFKLRPQLVVKASEDIPRAQRILDSAQGVCLISNSIRATVRVYPEFRVKGSKTRSNARAADAA